MSTVVHEGETLLAEGRVDEARDRFQKALRIDPRDKEALNDLGVISYRESANGKAVSYFAQALEVDPFHKPSILNLCQVLRDTEQIAGAINILEVAAQKYSDDTEIANLLEEARAATRPESNRPNTGVPGKDVLRKRVLLGTYEIANQSHTIAKALTARGMHAETLCYYPNYLKYKSDHVLNLANCANAEDAVLQSRKCADQMIPQFDIFHFHFGTTLTTDCSDLPVLKQLNKQVVMQYWGSDVRRLSMARKFNRYIKVKDLSEANIIAGLESVSRYVRTCVVCDLELYEYVKEFFDTVQLIPQLLNLDEYKPTEPKTPNDKFLIVHAPTDPELKGSKHIQKALEELSQDHSFEYKPVVGMSHDEAMNIYAQADLIVDQLHVGCHGLFAIESMAMAKPVITWISEFMRDRYPSDLPLISANPDTIKQTLAYALNNREMLIEKGLKGRAYVEKYHDMNKLGGQIIDMYAKL